MGDPRAPHTATPSELKARLEAERAGRPFLLYRDAQNSQRIFILGGSSPLTLGRGAGNDIALEWDAASSRLHAELSRMGEEWTIADDGLSRNGTWVNGRRLAGRRRLRDGDVILLGGTSIAFCAPVGAGPEETIPVHAVPSLSPAQRRVLLALCRPFGSGSDHAMPATNQQIAAELVVTVDAVKANLRALFEKFAVEDLPQNRKRARLVELAFQGGAVTRRELSRS